MARFLVNVQLDLFRSAVIYTHCYLLFAAALLHLCSGSVNNTGTPLPAVCGEKRGDRTVPNTVSSICEVKVQRYFFHRDKHCKKFSLCQSTATYLDGQADPNINYFRNMADCRQACTDVVECLHQPLEMENGYPVTLTGEEGVWGEIREGEKLGYGTTVRFECNEGYRLVEEENVHFCELNGTWSGEQPDCEIQCPKPASLAQNVSVSPMKNYYNVGEKLQLICMDGLEGNTTWTCKEQGVWEGRVPNCSRSCAPPPVDNAHPPQIDSTRHYSYRCYEGYSILNDSSILSCHAGQLDGVTPVCTRVEIRSSADGNRAMTLKNETVFFDLEEGSEDSALTCGLEGLDKSEHRARWILPTKPNGEVPPEVMRNGNILTFRTAYAVHNGEYICSIAGLNASVIVNVTATTTVDPPVVNYFDPNGVIPSPPGIDTTIHSLTSGTQPLNVTWQHNGMNLSRLSILNNTHYDLRGAIDDQTVFSVLTIKSLGNATQGVYKIVANNSGGVTMSEAAELTIVQQTSQRRFRRLTPFCDDPRKVVLVGVVRRIGRTKSGLQSIRLKVDRVLRGDADAIAKHHTMEVRIFSGADTERLRRGQSIVLSGVVPKGRIMYMFNTPIEDYSRTLENAIADC